MRRGAPYIRISKAKDGSTIGVERQLPPILETFKRRDVSVPAIERGMTVEEIIEELRQGKEVPGVFCDNDLSAYSGKRRPAYEAMMAEAQAGDWEVLGAWHADRFTRQPVENERLIELAERYGVDLLTSTGQHDLSTPSGRLHFRMLGSIARYESEHRAERLKLKHDELAAAGRWHGGKRPFGYVVVGTKLHGKRDDCTETDDDRCGLFKCHLELEPAEAAEIEAAAKQVIDRWAAGGPLGLTAIVARWVSVLGVRNVTSTAHLRAMLTNPRLAGLRRAPDGQLVQADWPAILTRGQHEQLVAILGAARSGGGERAPRRYLLTGFLHHAAPCGARLRSRPNRLGARAYVCDSRGGGCNGLMQMAEPIEDEVRDQVLAALASPELRAAFERYHARRLSAGEAARLHDQFAADKAKLAQLDILADDLGKAANDARAKIEQRMRAAQVRLQAGVATDAMADLPTDAAGLRAYWDAADLDGRRAVLRLVLRRVELVAGGKGKRFDPKRVVIPPDAWKV
jgi:DNA invertase Pin-like site-specific DNA recombinase